jgi:hypothetical protein
MSFVLSFLLHFFFHTSVFRRVDLNVKMTSKNRHRKVKYSKEGAKDRIFCCTVVRRRLFREFEVGSSGTFRLPVTQDYHSTSYRPVFIDSCWPG